MIKKLLLAIAIALPMSVFAQKFAVIDTQALMESLPEIKTVQEQMQASAAKYDEEFKNLQTEAQKKYDEFQALQNDPNALSTIKERRMSELQEIDAKMNQFRQAAQEDLQRQQAQLMAPVQEKVMKAIEAVGKEGAYTFVFEKGISLYSGADVVDLTDMVRSRLNQK